MPDSDPTRDADPFTPVQLAAGEKLFAQPWRFLKSVPALEFLPPAEWTEIAFAGRSNVGKSSLINAVVRQNHLARTSNTPGRTQELNYFRRDYADLYLVDMPGYGFAKAPKAKVESWTRLVKDYLAGRPTLARVFLLIDARHGIKPVDDEIMGLLDGAAVSYQVVLTKVDKIKSHDLVACRTATLALLSKHGAAYPEILATSSDSGAGIEDLRAAVAVIAGFA